MFDVTFILLDAYGTRSHRGHSEGAQCYGHVSRSVILLTLFLDTLSPVASTGAHTFLIESAEVDNYRDYWGEYRKKYYMISYVTELGFELATSGSAIRRATDCVQLVLARTCERHFYSK